MTSAFSFRKDLQRFRWQFKYVSINQKCAQSRDRGSQHEQNRSCRGLWEPAQQPSVCIFDYVCLPVNMQADQERSVCLLKFLMDSSWRFVLHHINMTPTTDLYLQTQAHGGSWGESFKFCWPVVPLVYLSPHLLWLFSVEDKSISFEQPATLFQKREEGNSQRQIFK